MRHVRLAFRTLFRTPFVTFVAALSLALGIGANAAIFSMFDQILLKPLPVPDAHQLVNLTAPGPKPGSQSCNQAGNCEVVFSYPMFKDLQERQTVLSGLAAHRAFGANLTVNNAPMTGDGMLVSGSYFPTLELAPAVGRLLGPSDAEKVGGSYVAVLSYDFWRTHFGSNPGAVGQAIEVNGRSLEIVGVAPRGFDGTTLGAKPDIFVPITLREEIEGRGGFENRRSYWAYLFGRLKPGVTLDQAATGLNAVYRPIINDVEAPLQEGMSDKTMARFRAKEVGVEPGYQGQSSVHEDAKAPLLMLLAVTGVVLLIACANIANLLLARGASRSLEMGVRLALGSGRGRLMAQLLTEAVLLALMGGVASLAVAYTTLKALGSILPPEASSMLTFQLQPAVVVFTAAVAVVTGLLFGLFPALHSTRSDLITAIRSASGQISGHQQAGRFRATLVTLQIALASGLLISAGLFLKSLINVAHVDLGVKVDDVVTFSISPKRSGYDSTRATLLYQQVADELAQMPGVTGVTSALVPLLAGSNWGTDVHVQGFPEGPDVDNNARYNEVGPGYFRTLGYTLLSGREFTSADGMGSGRVAVVNETFAKKFNLGNDAVGKFMSFRGPDSLDTQIVGLVQDAKYSSVKDEVPPLFYIPWHQDGDVSFLSFYARTALPPEQLVRDIPTLMKRIAPSVPIEEVKTMPQQIKENVFLDRMISILSTAFASLATLLAAVGLYGVLAYSVQQRTREIGVRMSLGANPWQVRGLVIRQVAWMLGVGGVLGTLAALAVGRALGSLLYGLKGSDPVVFSVSLAVLGLVALGAGYLPARRASKVDPITALRYE